MSTFAQEIVFETKQREKVALPVGTYGTGKIPGLKIVKALGAKATKNDGLYRHSFLVASTDDAIEGTSFLALNLREEWTLPAAVAIAFGVEEKAVASGELTEEDIMDFKDKLLASVEGDSEKYDKLVTQIRINVGTIFRLQDWGGQERNAGADLLSLEGVKFSGKTEPGFSGTTTEVSSVFSKK
jgi:hypothetical protein